MTEWFAEIQSVRAQPPKWLDLDTIPPLLQACGTPLPPELVAKAIADLKSLGPDSRGAVMDVLQQRIRPVDLTALADALWGAWAASDQPSRDRAWVQYAMGHLGDHGHINALGWRVQEERAAKRHRAAGTCIDALTRSSSPVARQWLGHWTRRASTLSMRRLAWSARMVWDAHHPGQTWVTPYSHGFSTAGMRDYNHAGRMLQLCLTLDGALEIREQDRLLRTLPAARKRDDPQAVRASRARFSALKEVIKHSDAMLNDALQEAMVLQQPLADWTAFARSALAWRVSRGLIYTAGHPDTLQIPFLLTDEGDAVDVRGGDLTLPEDTPIRVLHPLTLTLEARQAWQTLLQDARATPPFEQLQRPTTAKPQDAEPLSTLLRTQPALAPARLIRGLARMGFLPDTLEHGTLVRQSVAFLGSYAITVHHDPYPINPYNLRHDRFLRMHNVALLLGNQPISSASLPPLVYSELASGLAAL